MYSKNQSQIHNESNKKLIIGFIFIVTIWIIFSFYIEIKIQGKDQEKYRRMFENGDKIRRVNTVDDEFQDKNEVKVEKENGWRKMAEFDSFFFEPVQNWYRKQQIKDILQKQRKKQTTPQNHQANKSKFKNSLSYQITSNSQSSQTQPKINFQPTLSNINNMGTSPNQLSDNPFIAQKLSQNSQFSQKNSQQIDKPNNNQQPSTQTAPSFSVINPQRLGSTSYSRNPITENQKNNAYSYPMNSNSFTHINVNNINNTPLQNTIKEININQGNLKSSFQAQIRKSKSLNDNKNIQTTLTVSNVNIPPISVPNTAYYKAGITPQQVDFAKRLLNLKNQPAESAMAQAEKKYYEEKYQISAYPEQPFCIVIPTFNNVQGNRYIHNLNSILQQDYSNYRIILIDDASEDQTGEKVRQFAEEHQISQNKLKIVINRQRKMAMPNLYGAAKEFCKPYQIFIILDGDDEIVGRQVLKFFNSQFQSKKYWLVYSNFITMSGMTGYSRPYNPSIIERNDFRKAGFVISHLRAFYTKLFILIREEDLKDEQGNWFRAANDVAMYMPILQMVHNRHAYIPQICYMYNSNTGFNNHRVKLSEQKGNERKVKAKKPYGPLKQLFTQKQKQALEESMNKKIEIKDHNLPIAQPKVKYSWEL